METYKIIFYREDADDKNAEEVEFMAANELAAMQTFKNAEPFVIIVKIESVV